jgi:hypothetical protein
MRVLTSRPGRFTHSTHRIGGCEGVKAVQDVLKKIKTLVPLGIRTPDRPPRSLVAIPTNPECSYEDRCTEKSNVLVIHTQATASEHIPTHTSPRFVESGPKYGGQFSCKQN